jgi:hypothetical protein
MSKKAARTIANWGGVGGSPRRRRRVRPHVRRAAGRAFGLALVAIPASVYLLYCLCRIGGEAHFHLMPVGSTHPQDGSPWGDRASMMRQSATEPHPH